MKIILNRGRPPMLEEADDFVAFAVHATSIAAGDVAQGDCDPAGRLDADGAHLWVDPQWLVASAPATAGWRTGFDAMIAYADRKGWRDADGAIRAHIVFAMQA